MDYISIKFEENQFGQSRVILYYFILNLRNLFFHREPHFWPFVALLYDPFGVDVPLNFDITHSHTCRLPLRQFTTNLVHVKV